MRPALIEHIFENNDSSNGEAFKLENVIALSIISSTTGAGINATAQLQVSNDPIIKDSPSNWISLTGKLLTINGTDSEIIEKFDVSYNWGRIVFTDSSGGTATGTSVIRTKTIGF